MMVRILWIMLTLLFMTTGFSSPLNDNPFEDLHLNNNKNNAINIQLDYPKIVLNLMEISTYVILGMAVIGLVGFALGSYQNNPQLKRYGRNFLIMSFTMWILLLTIPYVIVQIQVKEIGNPFPFTVIDVVKFISILAAMLNFIMMLHAANRLIITVAEKNPDSKSKAMNAIITHAAIIAVSLVIPPIGSLIT